MIYHLSSEEKRKKKGGDWGDVWVDIWLQQKAISIYFAFTDVFFNAHHARGKKRNQAKGWLNFDVVVGGLKKIEREKKTDCNFRGQWIRKLSN